MGSRTREMGSQETQHGDYSLICRFLKSDEMMTRWVGIGKGGSMSPKSNEKVSILRF